MNQDLYPAESKFLTLLVIVHVPIQILAQGLVNRIGYLRQIDGGVMLETVFTDELQQLLQVGNTPPRRSRQRF